MSSGKKDYRALFIGAFVIAGVLLLVLSTLAVGGRAFFSETFQYVLYFRGSVKGLRIGSPVSFRGARIGTVKDVTLEFNPKDLAFRIPVQVEIEPGLIRWTDKAEEELLEHGDLMERLVSSGLRGQLALESFVTGQLYIQLDLRPEIPAELMGSNRDVPEIPTIKSSFDLIAERVEQLPLDEVVGSLQRAVSSLDEILRSPELRESMVKLPKMIESAQLAIDNVGGLVARVDEELKPIDDLITTVNTEVREVAGETKRTIESARTSLNSLSGAVTQRVGDGGPLVDQLARTLKDLSGAARAMETLAQTLDRHPEAMLRGKK